MAFYLYVELLTGYTKPMIQKQWKLKERYPASYAKAFSEDDLTLQLLFNRGIRTQEEAGRFFLPDYDRDSHNPFLLQDMEKAVVRFLEAMKKNEKILIFSDYDADGVCGTIVFSDFFRFTGYENFFLFNPDRYKEGYGMGTNAMDAVLKENPALVITVDTGIRDEEGIRILQKKGIDVIVTDHHLPPETLPPAYAVINHKREDNTYPFPWLCGTGMAFKFVQGLFKKGIWPLKEGYEKWMLDMVAIATVCDMMPLKDENRTFVYWGLEVIRKNRRPGLKALLESNQYLSASSLTSNDIAFSIGPLINAAGRLDHANMAVELLRAEHDEEARWLASRLNGTNTERKRMTQEIVISVNEKYVNEPLPSVIALGDASWYPGVLGNTAGRLVEEYARPVFLYGKGGGKFFKGSSRSDGSVNLVALMEKAGEDLFETFGGHAMAAGFTLKEGKEKEFAGRVNQAYQTMEKQENISAEIHIEKELSLDDIDWDMYALISRFEPLGEGNPRPIFLFNALRIENVRLFGNGSNHVELQFKKSNNEIVKAISFGGAKAAEALGKGMVIDLVASLERSTFRDSDELRLRIVDYRVKRDSVI